MSADKEFRARFDQAKGVIFEMQLANNRQDREIEELKKEIQDLKLRLAVLISMLDAKGVVSEKQILETMGDQGPKV